MKKFVLFVLFLSGIIQFTFGQPDSLNQQIRIVLQAYKNRPNNLPEDRVLIALNNPGQKVLKTSSRGIRHSSIWYPFSGLLLQDGSKQEVWFDGKVWQCGNIEIETHEYFANTFSKIMYFAFLIFLIFCPFFLERKKFIKNTKTESDLADGMLDIKLNNIWSYLISNGTFWLILFFLVVFDVLILGIPVLSAYIVGLSFSFLSIDYWRRKMIKAYKDRPRVFLSSDDD